MGLQIISLNQFLFLSVLILFFFISGTEKFIDNLLNIMGHEPSFLLGSVSVFLCTIITCNNNNNNHFYFPFFFAYKLHVFYN